jgi:hypothetical protein
MSKKVATGRCGRNFNFFKPCTFFGCFIEQVFTVTQSREIQIVETLRSPSKVPQMKALTFIDS